MIQVEPGAQDIYNGVDFTESVRLPRGLTVTGGVSIGHEVVNNCYALNDLSRSCGFRQARSGESVNIVPPFQPNVKFLVALHAALVWDSGGSRLPEHPRTANHRELHSHQRADRPSLGRNLATGVNGTATIDLIPPATRVRERLNQLDLRVTKRFKLPEGRSIQGNVDLYNSLNSDAMIGQVLTLRANLAEAVERPAGPVRQVQPPVPVLRSSPRGALEGLDRSGDARVVVRQLPRAWRAPGRGRQARRSMTLEWVSDRAAETGLNFTHFNGMSGKFYYPEIIAGVGGARLRQRR